MLLLLVFIIIGQKKGEQRLSFPNENNILIADTGLYLLQMTDGYGCMYEDSINVLPTSMSIDPEFLMPSGFFSHDSLQFIDLSYPTPTTWYWEFGDMLTSNVQDPVHVYYSAGNYSVELSVFNGFCNASVSKPIHLKYNKKLFYIDENTNESNAMSWVQFTHLNVGPNPFKDRLNLDIAVSCETDILLRFYNVQGQLIQTAMIEKAMGYTGALFTSNLPKGLYILQIIVGNNRKVVKLIKK